MDQLRIPLDDLASPTWSDLESSNVALVVDFIQHLMNDHDFDYVRDRFATQAYVQHNRTLPDGIAGLVDVVSRFAKRFPEYTYDVKRILADGDYVVFHSHATIRAAHRGDDSKGLNITDTWRIADGQIVEHWDSVEAIDGLMRFYALLTGGRVRNANGVF